MLLSISLGFWRFHIWLLNLPLFLYIWRVITLVCVPRAQEAEAEAGGLPVAAQFGLHTEILSPNKIISNKEMLTWSLECWTDMPWALEHGEAMFSQAMYKFSFCVFLLSDTSRQACVKIIDSDRQYTHVMLGYIDNELKVSGQCNYYYYFWQDVGDGEWFIF